MTHPRHSDPTSKIHKYSVFLFLLSSFLLPEFVTDIFPSRKEVTSYSNSYICTEVTRSTCFESRNHRQTQGACPTVSRRKEEIPSYRWLLNLASHSLWISPQSIFLLDVATYVSWFGLKWQWNSLSTILARVSMEKESKGANGVSLANDHHGSGRSNSGYFLREEKLNAGTKNKLQIEKNHTLL